MVYINSFRFPDDGDEFNFLIEIKRRCYDTFYPFKVLSSKGLTDLEFEPITILCGGNGCGKTTALNVIADSLGINRNTPLNRSNFFDDYVKMCRPGFLGNIPRNSKLITSDDVFEYMLDMRKLNERIDTRREELFDEYLTAKYSNFKFSSMEDYEELKKVNQSRSKTQSKFVRQNLMDNVIGKSNGENAFKYFTENIRENALYLLDEPENSLSPERQIELVNFLEESARFFGCQFIISTHSPFILALKGAKIYDLDGHHAQIKKWTDLKNVNILRNFFKEREEEFQ